MEKKKEEMRSFSVRMPLTLMKEIDLICSSHYMSRSCWLIKAAKELLEKERTNSADEMIAKIASREST